MKSRIQNSESPQFRIKEEPRMGSILIHFRILASDY